MGLEGMLSEISQTQTLYFIYEWNLQNKPTKTIKRKTRKRLINIGNKLVVIRGEEGMGIGE